MKNQQSQKPVIQRKEIREKITVHRGMHIMECPECKNICASAAERSWLPEWAMCDNPNCNY